MPTTPMVRMVTAAVLIPILMITVQTVKMVPAVVILQAQMLITPMARTAMVTVAA